MCRFFRTVSPEALLKFIMFLQKIIQGQYMSTVLQKFGMTRNLVVREALWVFEQENRYRVTEANANYELVMKGFIVHLFLPEALQLQKRYLQRGLYQPRNRKIRSFICYIYDMVEYPIHFPPLGAGQRLPDKEILKQVEFSLLREWQKELIIQGFNSTTQGLMKPVKLCERLETAEKFFHTQDKINHQNKKKLSSPVKSTNPPIQSIEKGQTWPQNPWKSILTKIKIGTYMCTLFMDLDMILTHVR